MNRHLLRLRKVLTATSVGLLAVAGLAGVAAAPASAATGSTLAAGQWLHAGESLTSTNGALRLTMQGDGNLVLYAPGGSARWNTGTNGHAGAGAVMQGDGNLVVYDAGGAPLWHSFAHGGAAGGDRLVLQDDGNLVIYAGGTPTWNSGTFYLPSTIKPGTTLNGGDGLQSDDATYVLKMQGDGNLVLYRSDGSWVWHSHTENNPGSRLVFQGDGNLVIYSAAGTALWHTSTYGKNPNRLVVQNDGNVVLYTAAGSPVWYSFAATNIVKAASGGADVTASDAARQLLASPRFSATSESRAQIQAVANGTVLRHTIDGVSRSCSLDPALLTTLRRMVVDEGHTVVVTSFNRFCTNTLTPSGVYSYHYRNGGGHAVDLGRIDGAENANEGGMVNFAQRWVTIVPKPAGIGQSNCRATPLALPSGVVQFSDTCNHLHLEYRG